MKGLTPVQYRNQSLLIV
ncbi:hypothetical protein [Anaerorhabdus sp.]